MLLRFHSVDITYTVDCLEPVPTCCLHKIPGIFISPPEGLKLIPRARRGAGLGAIQLPDRRR